MVSRHNRYHLFAEIKIIYKTVRTDSVAEATSTQSQQPNASKELQKTG